MDEVVSSISNGEILKWLVELSKDSITSWLELTEAFLERIIPPSRTLMLQDIIQNSKWVDVEPIHETCLRFQKWCYIVLITSFKIKCYCNTFTRVLISWTRGYMRQQFEVALVLHNEMNKINCACHTREGWVWMTSN